MLFSLCLDKNRFDRLIKNDYNFASILKRNERFGIDNNSGDINIYNIVTNDVKVLRKSVDIIISMEYGSEIIQYIEIFKKDIVEINFLWALSQKHKREYILKCPFKLFICGQEINMKMIIYETKQFVISCLLSLGLLITYIGIFNMFITDNRAVINLILLGIGYFIISILFIFL